MKKTTIVWLIIAVFLLLVGCILAKLLMVKYETNTYEVGKTFSDISMKTDTADIILALSDDGKCKVECYERSTGDVEFSGCDADEIYVKTTTGNVTGSFLSNKVFITDTDTGSVDVPKTATGGRCEINTHTGDIKIKID